MSADISLRLTAERTRLGYSQADFARALRVTRETMRKWEAGLSMISAEALSASFAIGVDVQYVLTGIRSATDGKKSTINVGTINQGAANIEAGGTAHFVTTVNHTTKIKTETKPGSEHITDTMAATLKEMVAQIVSAEEKIKKKPATYKSVWAAFNNHFKIPSYRLLPLTRFDEGRAYLNQWMGRIHAAPTASVKDGDTWRRRKIAYIKVNSKEDEDKVAVAAYVREKFREESISQLSNDQLEAVYRYVAGRRSRRR